MPQRRAIQRSNFELVTRPTNEKGEFKPYQQIANSSSRVTQLKASLLPPKLTQLNAYAQGTMQMKGKVNINDDEHLEKEADEMGAKALQLRPIRRGTQAGVNQNQTNSSMAIALIQGPATNKIAGTGAVAQLSIAGTLAGHAAWQPGGPVSYKTSRSKAGAVRKPMLEIGPNAGGFTLHVHLEFERPITAMSGWNLKNDQGAVVASDPDGRRLLTSQDIALLNRAAGSEHWLRPGSYGIDERIPANQPAGERLAMTHNINALRGARDQTDQNLQASQAQLVLDQANLQAAQAALNNPVVVNYTWQHQGKKKGTTGQRATKIHNAVPALAGAQAALPHVNNLHISLPVTYNDVASFNANHAANSAAIDAKFNGQNFNQDSQNVTAINLAVTNAQNAIGVTQGLIQQHTGQLQQDTEAHHIATAPQRNEFH